MIHELRFMSPGYHIFKGLMWLCCATSILCLTAKPLDVLVVTPGLTGFSATATITRAGPGFEVALHRLKTAYTNIAFSHVYLYNRSIPDCGTFANNAQYILSQWFYEQDGDRGTMPIYMVTTGCFEPALLNQLAAAWNMFYITVCSSDEVIRDKSKSPTWINTNFFPTIFFGDIFYRLFLMQNWTSVYVVLDLDSIPIYQLVFGALDKLVRPKVRTVNIQYSSRKEGLDFHALLKSFATQSRVMLFLGSASQLRLLLLSAAARGQTTGEYVFIAAVPFPYKVQGIFTWQTFDQNDEIIRAAYRSVIFVTMVDASPSGLHVTEAQLDDLKSKWNAEFKRNPFYGNQDLRDEPSIPHLASANAAMEMLAQVLNESMTDPDFDPRNGRALARRFLSRTFDTSSGRISLDQFGDRTPSVSVSYFNDTTGDFEVYIRSNITKGDYRYSAVKPVSWFNGSHLPPNEPMCGYMGDKLECRPRTGIQTRELFAGVGVAVVALIVGSICLGCLIRSRVLKDNGAPWWTLNGGLLEASARRIFSLKFCQSLKQLQRYPSQAPD
ncbi:hypothetical protein BV898_18352 [Hypsibius exemplaris]|uniref:Receptor ligand binding region domain-containing protein n=1 Tax=Hypsibius exemplaris TaxID=2072580 RepID=A0A9X6RN23_HYPEX|nr:hypothetical protein BV898_18352 [Hypsibius exemplaris]